MCRGLEAVHGGDEWVCERVCRALCVCPGYDYINRAEATLGNVMADGGYKTAHFGKWHNGRTLGYEPWEMGFQESWLPTSHVHLDNLMRCV